MKIPAIGAASLVATLLSGLAQMALADGNAKSPAFTLVPSPRVHHAPHLRDASDNSTNWAGYAVESSLSDPAFQVVTLVTGSWVVPTVTGVSGKAAYSATWVGIDGFDDAQLQAALSGLSAAEKRDVLLAIQTVEQIGTEQDWNGKSADYYAWVEFYPDASSEIRNFPVKAGDAITASVAYVGNDQFKVTLTNTTENATYSATQTFQADRYSAEWIQEAPSVSSGTLPLADFGTVTFSNCSATIGGKTLPIGESAWEQINMETESGAPLATASTLVGTGAGFSVVWNASGGTSKTGQGVVF